MENTQRNDLVDVLRIGSAVVVVGMHWVSTHVWWQQSGDSPGLVTGLALHGPVALALGWALQVMPLLFLTGGFSNATVITNMQQRGSWSYRRYLAVRARRMTLPMVWFVVALGTVIAGLQLVSPSIAGMAGTVATRPLWFLAVYLVTIALAPWFLKCHDHHPAATSIGLGIVVLVADIARIIGNISWLSWVSLIVVWLLCQQWGFWYQRKNLQHTPTWVLGMAFLASAVGLWALVSTPLYPVAMFGTADHSVTNLSPPTLVMAWYGFAQLLIILLGGRVFRVLTGKNQVDLSAVWTARIRTGNALMMGVYLWHVPALLLVTAVGLAAPSALLPESAALFWAHRPAWILGASLVLTGLLLAANRWERFHARAETTTSLPYALAGTGAATIGVFLLWDAGLTLTGPGIAGAALILIAAATLITPAPTKDHKQANGQPQPINNA